MTTYKYTDETNTVVHVIDEDGISRSSCMVSDIADWIAKGDTPEPSPSPALTVKSITDAMDDLFNLTAQSKHYDNRITCALRAGYPGPFQSEGLAFASWMDAQNLKAYQMLAQVESGDLPMPKTVQEALALLSPMVWPQNNLS